MLLPQRVLHRYNNIVFFSKIISHISLLFLQDECVLVGPSQSGGAVFKRLEQLVSLKLIKVNPFTGLRFFIFLHGQSGHLQVSPTR